MRLEEIKDRKIIRWIIAYAAAAWALLQVVQFLAGVYTWPPAILRLLPVLLAAGLLATIVLAWFHGEKGEQRATTLEIGMLTGICVLAGGAMFVARQSVASHDDAETAAAPVLSQASVAVLPFENFSADRQQEYFSDGITEEILNALAQVNGLQVAARTSSFAVKGQKLQADEIGRRLHVAHVLEGSVRKVGNRVRITAQLINARNGYHIWSQAYTRDMSDVLALQDEIARNVASVLRVKLMGGTSAAPARRVSPAAHDEYLLGLSLFNHRTNSASLRSALAHFQRAVDLQPDYAEAYAGIALVHTVMPTYDPAAPGTQEFPIARKHAERALQLDSTLAEAHAVLGMVENTLDHNWKSGDAHFARALELNPNYANAWQWRAATRFARDPQAAVHDLEEGIARDPLSRIMRDVYGYGLLNVGRVDEAGRAFDQAIALDTTWDMGYVPRAQVYLLKNDSINAYATIDRGIAYGKIDSVYYYMARAYFHPELAKEVRKRMSNVRHGHRAVALAFSHDRDGALKEMMNAIEAAEGDQQLLVYHPLFKAYENDPRYKAAVKKLKL